MRYVQETDNHNLTIKRHHKCLSIVPESQQNFFDSFLHFQPPQLATEIIPSIQNSLVDQSMQDLEEIVSLKQETDTSDHENVMLSLEYAGENDCWIGHELDNGEIINHDEETLLNESENLMVQDESSSCTQLKQEETPKVSLEQNHSTMIQPSTSGSKQDRLFCAKCGYQFDSVSHFRAHQNGHRLFEVVAKVSTFPTCVDCNFMFCNEPALEMHKISNHERIPMDGKFLRTGKRRSIFVDVETINESAHVVKCGHCTKEFGDIISSSVHQYLHHVMIPKCPFENREFNNNQAFSVHMKNNHPAIFNDNEIFKCKTCNRNFDNLYDKLKHMKNCDMMKFECSHCDKKFRLRCFLKTHLEQVSGLTARACTICEKNFSNKRDLNIHFRSHTNEKPFKCSLCPKAYKTSSARASHQETHSVNGFKCNFCKSRFKARRIMLKHYKDKHKNIKNFK